MEYYGEDPCNSDFVCAKLSGNPCGDYALSLQYSQESSDVCFEGVHYRDSIGFSDDVLLNLWYTEKAQFELKCFFWCKSHSGPQMPINTTSEVSSEFLLNVVSFQASISLFDELGYQMENQANGKAYPYDAMIAQVQV